MRKQRLARAAFAATLLIAALPAVADFRPIRFDRISLEDGLSQSTVLCIYQDARGFVWFGTEDGLNRYDGHTFRVYKHDPARPDSLSHDTVWAVDEDSSGNLWIATMGGGISMWERGSDTFRRYGVEEGLSSLYVRTLHVAHDGAVWVGTRDDGLDRLEPESGEIVHFRHDPSDSTSLGDDRVYVIHSDRSKQIWVGTDAGLNRFDATTGGFAAFTHDSSDPDSLSDDRVRSVFEGTKGQLWVGTYGGGINRLDLSTGLVDRYRHDPDDSTSLSHDRVRAILEDRAGRLWIGTSGGLNLLDERTGGFVHYRHDGSSAASLSDDNVMSLFEDAGGVLWAGTRTGGVNKWNPLSWQFNHRAPEPSSPDGLSGSNVISFSEDREGRIWIATFGGGLDVLDRRTGRFKHYRNNPEDPISLSSDRVTALLHDHSGTLWAGTLDAGINRFDPTNVTFKRYRHDPLRVSSLGADGIMTLFEDSRGVLWAGTFGGGLDRLDRRTGTFSHFVPNPDDPSTISGDRVTSIAEDGKGFLWVGTDGGGLNRLDPWTGKFVQFRHDPADPSSLGTDTVFSLHIDPLGTLWVGTRGGGLGKLAKAAQASSGAKFRNYSERDGLPNEVIYAIVPDFEGDLWLSTNNGLSHFDPSAETFRNYDVDDGLQSNEFHFGAGFSSADGKLYFGGVNGYNSFDPERLRHNTHVPAVVLTSFLKFNRPVEGVGPAPEMESLQLGYRDDVVSFEFAALDFNAPGSNRYAYKLEGFDEDWIELGDIHRVTYTDLDPGKYVFRVKAANNDGVWNPDGLAVDVDVDPPPWRTAWAYGSYALLIAGTIYGSWRVQRRKLEREAEYSRRLEKEVEARTEELAERATELEELNARLVKTSVTDSLTGLANRRFLLEYLDKEVELIKRRYSNVAAGALSAGSFDLVFMMVDLDDFKAINDTCGHASGDRVLQQLREILEGACRKSDILVRWGGDEFLVVGRDSKSDRLENLAERIRSRIEGHAFELDDGQVVRTTCSIGFACFPFIRDRFDALSWEQVVSVADRALYVAKRTCRNAWVGFMSTGLTPTRGLLASLRHDPSELASSKFLDVRTSIRDTPLVWDRPDASRQIAKASDDAVEQPQPVGQS